MWVVPLRFAPLRFAPLMEVRLAEVRTDVGVLVTPRVPGLYPLLEQCDVLVVRHESTRVVVPRPNDSSA